MSELSFNNQVGESEEFYTFQEKLRKAASVDRSVLLIGERGSGKEFAASRLHYLSSRWNKSFVKLNCAALPPSLIETELFGHVKGAYTGADRERKGRFEEADAGTLFLDEIGLIPFEVQEKILRVVEYGTFERVGSSETKEINVRIIGAANQDLPSLCREGKFKQDLLDRLSFEVLFVPPLRARGEDIIILADHFAQKMGRELGKKGRIAFTEEVVDKLKSCSWPGNIRELKNTVERAVYRTDGNVIGEIVLNPFVNPYEDNNERMKDNDSPAYNSAAEEDEFLPVENNDLNTERDNYEDLISASESGSSGSGKEIKSFVLKQNEGNEDFKHDSLRLRTINNIISCLEKEREKSVIEENTADYKIITDIIKKELISTALESTGNNQKNAAALLNLSYDQFRGTYRKYFTKQ